MDTTTTVNDNGNFARGFQRGRTMSPAELTAKCKISGVDLGEPKWSDKRVVHGVTTLTRCNRDVRKSSEAYQGGSVSRWKVQSLKLRKLVQNSSKHINEIKYDKFKK